MRRNLIPIAVIASATAWIAQPTAPRPPRTLPGWALYDRYCLACHGGAGDGRGPAAAFTRGRPRDLTKGDFAWRTTTLGDPPTDDDLRLTIERGAPGTSMHAFALSRGELDQLVEVVKSFAPTTFAKPGTPIALAAPPAPDAARGAQLWRDKGCNTCHGAAGAGDTKLAAPPYDLTREPLHRPRPDGDLRRAAALAIATGRTAMPGYSGSIPDADIWALADHVVALNAKATTDTRIDARTIAADRGPGRVIAGTWPGHDAEEAAVFGAVIPPQGPPPPTLAPAQASLSAQQCARCHAKQYREWGGSFHAGASSPGLAAQMMGMKPAEAKSCLKCHAPLAEQQTDDTLYAQGLSCAGCHVRSWKRHGPPALAPSLLSQPGYPLATLALYERADFCMPCHQLPPRSALEGRPLLDTYREWLEGPYMKRGIQCQHCHMPNREHTFLGIHDPETFRQGIALTARASAKAATVTVVAELANIGAGHYLPTNPTPAAWIEIQLVDAKGTEIAGAATRYRIGRDIYYDGTWHQREDTRIPPGDKATVVRAWSGGRVGNAASARIRIVVHPDDYYEHLYIDRLAGKLAPERRALYEEALAKAKRNRYTALERAVPISR
jgi:mono/diheme cytochrome c family protein